MRQIALLSSIIFLLVACQKEIKVDLNEAQPRVVIEANYIATDSIVHVKVTRTGSYFNSYVEDFVNDAQVYFTDHTGSIIPVPFVDSGKYVAINVVPSYGATYSMKVVVDGVTYEAQSKLMPVMTLLPTEAEYSEATMFSEAGYHLFYSFQDFQGLGNCYKLITTFNGVRYDKLGEFQKGSDKLTDGNLVERLLMKTFQLGDTARLELQCINQRVFDYYDQLSSTTSGFNAAVGNPDYCWTNDAFGYFSAYGYSIDELVIE